MINSLLVVPILFTLISVWDFSRKTELGEKKIDIEHLGKPMICAERPVFFCSKFISAHIAELLMPIQSAVI